MFILHPSGIDGLSLDITILVDIRDQNNKELFMRLVTDIQSEDTFYTDLNGFQVRIYLFKVHSVAFLFTEHLPSDCLELLQKHHSLFVINSFFYLANKFCANWLIITQYTN